VAGSHDFASFCSALDSFPASGPAMTSTSSHPARTIHFARRPAGRLMIARALLIPAPSLVA
jgi:hypothetical protein